MSLEIDACRTLKLFVALVCGKIYLLAMPWTMESGPFETVRLAVVPSSRELCSNCYKDKSETTAQARQEVIPSTITTVSMVHLLMWRLLAIKQA